MRLRNYILTFLLICAPTLFAQGSDGYVCSEDATTYSVMVQVAYGTLSCDEQSGATITHDGNIWTVSGLENGTERTIRVTDDYGCSSYITAYKLCVKPEKQWPTIFMPYDDASTNKDFLVDIEEGPVELYVFDRNGNMIAHSYNGWDGYANINGTTAIAMPGVYYYKAILPDGSTRKGNVEVYKKSKY